MEIFKNLKISIFFQSFTDFKHGRGTIYCLPKQ